MIHMTQSIIVAWWKVPAAGKCQELEIKLESHIKCSTTLLHDPVTSDQHQVIAFTERDKQTDRQTCQHQIIAFTERTTLLHDPVTSDEPKFWSNTNKILSHNYKPHDDTAETDTVTGCQLPPCQNTGKWTNQASYSLGLDSDLNTPIHLIRKWVCYKAACFLSHSLHWKLTLLSPLYLPVSNVLYTLTTS